jgi:hypothetical protein
MSKQSPLHEEEGQREGAELDYAALLLPLIRPSATFSLREKGLAKI